MLGWTHMWTEMENCKMGTKGTEPWHLSCQESLRSPSLIPLFCRWKIVCTERLTVYPEKVHLWARTLLPRLRPSRFYTLCHPPVTCVNSRLGMPVGTVLRCFYRGLESVGLKLHLNSKYTFGSCGWAAGLGWAAQKEVLKDPGGSGRLAPGLRVSLTSKPALTLYSSEWTVPALTLPTSTLTYLGD